MATITEDYVSKEIAKLLKKKGFDWDCVCISHPHYGMYFPGRMINNTELQFTKEADLCSDKENLLTIPSLQIAMKWLRRVHNLEIYPFHDAFQENSNWWFRIEKHTKGCRNTMYESDFIYLEYEDACQAAIKYCLDHLI